jgi:hypothetical protein
VGQELIAGFDVEAGFNPWPRAIAGEKPKEITTKNLIVRVISA